MPQTPSQTDTYNTALDIFDKTHPLRVDMDENLKVVLASGSVDIGKVDQGLGGTSPWLVSVNNFPASVAVTGPLTDAQLRATPVSITGTIAVTQSGAWTTGRTWTLLNTTDSVNVGNFPATQPVSGTVTANQGTSPWVVSGTVSPSTVSSSVLTNTSASTSSVTLLASNASRKMATIYNDSNSVLFVKFGTTASSTSFTVKMSANSYYEFPSPVYTGQIDGIWTVAVGAARMTELT